MKDLPGRDRMRLSDCPSPSTEGRPSPRLYSAPHPAPRSPWHTREPHRWDVACSANASPCNQAALKQLPRNKVPNMAVMIKSLSRSTMDASVVFKDPTGEESGPGAV